MVFGGVQSRQNVWPASWELVVNAILIVITTLDFLRHGSGVRFVRGQWPPMTIITGGLMHYRGTVVPAIPCLVASPQSQTPFHRAFLNVPEF